MPRLQPVETRSPLIRGRRERGLSAPASLRQWREQVRHREAQRSGRKKWYEWYRMEVATVTRTSSFDRP